MALTEVGSKALKLILQTKTSLCSVGLSSCVMCSQRESVESIGMLYIIGSIKQSSIYHALLRDK